MEFIDAWHEGDGGRVTRCWCFLLPHFLVANNRKYALESLRLQMQIKAILSPHLAQHIWDRFINTRGGIGKTYPVTYTMNISTGLSNTSFLAWEGT